jgi:hypothetical protein
MLSAEGQMKLYVFACKNLTNIWAGIGAKTWAVSIVDSSNTQARITRAQNVRIGQFGIIYCTDELVRSLTTPFIIATHPDPERKVKDIWPEEWSMPFGIHPLGTPKKLWAGHDAVRELPSNKDSGNTHIGSVFKHMGTTVFSPIDIGDDDWAMIVEKLGDIVP